MAVNENDPNKETNKNFSVLVAGPIGLKDDKSFHVVLDGSSTFVKK